MLPERPWKLESIVRLLLSVFVCVCAGSVLASALGAGVASMKARIVEVWALVCLATTLVLLRKRWTIENLTARLAIILLCFYAGLVLAVWSENLSGEAQRVPSPRQFVVGMVSFQGAILVLTAYFLGEQETTWKEAFGLANRWKTALVWGVVAACIFLPIGGQIQQLCRTVLEHWSRSPFKPEEQLPVQTLRLAETFGKRLVLGVATVVLAPAAEETLFRGILYPAIKQAGYPKLALLLTSVAFAGMHANAVAFLPLLVLSIILTALYEKTGNLLAPIVAHALFNSIGVVELFHQQAQS